MLSSATLWQLTLMLVCCAIHMRTGRAGVWQHFFGNAQESSTSSDFDRSRSFRRDREIRYEELSGLFSMTPFLRENLERSSENLRALLQYEESDACWKEANQGIITQGCDHLDYNIRSKFAAKLTRCHLKHSGMGSVCSDHLTDDECREALMQNPTAFSTYNIFFTHVDGICWYSQGKQFQITAEEAVNRLLQATVLTGQELNNMDQHFQTVTANLQDQVTSGTSMLKDELKQLAQEEQLRFKSIMRSGSSIDRALDELMTKHSLAREQTDAFVDEVRRRADRIAAYLHNSSDQLQSINTSQSVLTRSLSNMTHVVSILETGQASILSRQTESLANERRLKQMQNNMHNKMALLVTQQQALRNISKQAREELGRFKAEQAKAMSSTQEVLNNLMHDAEAVDHTLAQVSLKLEQVLHLDSVIFAELFHVHSKVYYAISVIVTFLLTSTSVTYPARLSLYLLMTGHYGLESLLALYVVDGTFETTALRLRKCTFVLSLCVIDERKQTNNLLKQVHQVLKARSDGPPPRKAMNRHDQTPRRSSRLQRKLLDGR